MQSILVVSYLIFMYTLCPLLYLFLEFYQVRPSMNDGLKYERSKFSLTTHSELLALMRITKKTQTNKTI